MERLTEDEMKAMRKMVNNINPYMIGFNDVGTLELTRDELSDYAIYEHTEGDFSSVLTMPQLMLRFKDVLELYAPQYFGLTDKETETVYNLFDKTGVNVRGIYYNEEFDIDNQPASKLIYQLRYAKSADEAQKIADFIAYDFAYAKDKKTSSAYDCSYSKFYAEGMKEKETFLAIDGESTLADIKLMIIEADKDKHKRPHEEFMIDGEPYTVTYDGYSETVDILYYKESDDGCSYRSNNAEWSKKEILDWDHEALMERLNALRFYAQEINLEEEQTR